MLQQTQTQRVLQKYHEFLKKFPSWRALSKAPLADVLRTWSGLGYNRRAKFLHEAAKIIVSEHRSKLPKTIEALRSLPGIGEYTAGALLAFIYNQPIVCIETNIRTVFIDRFFKHAKGKISDAEILPLIQQTVDTKSPRKWYYALMDFGVELKSNGRSQNHMSASITKQSPFKGSRREIRGAILKLLARDKRIQERSLPKILKKDQIVVYSVVSDLKDEGLIVKKNQFLHLAGDI